jgi:hypothetical protein
MYRLAMWGTRGSEGFGSQRREDSERMTFRTERAGDQLFLRMSRQIPPASDLSRCAGEEKRSRSRREVSFDVQVLLGRTLSTHDVAVIHFGNEL